MSVQIDKLKAFVKQERKQSGLPKTAKCDVCGKRKQRYSIAKTWESGKFISKKITCFDCIHEQHKKRLLIKK